MSTCCIPLGVVYARVLLYVTGLMMKVCYMYVLNLKCLKSQYFFVYLTTSGIVFKLYYVETNGGLNIWINSQAFLLYYRNLLNILNEYEKRFHINLKIYYVKKFNLIPSTDRVYILIFT